MLAWWYRLKYTHDTSIRSGYDERTFSLILPQTIKEKRMHLTKAGVIFGVMGCSAGVAYLLLVINDVQSLKDNSITSPVMCNQSLSGKWICTRVTKSVAKALSIRADLKIYATAWWLVAGRSEPQPSLSFKIKVQPVQSNRYGWLPSDI